MTTPGGEGNSGRQAREIPVCAYCGVPIRYRETMVERGTDFYCCLNCAVEDAGTEWENIGEEGAASRPGAPTNPADGTPG